jgi:hypothetical protein
MRSKIKTRKNKNAKQILFFSALIFLASIAGYFLYWQKMRVKMELPESKADTTQTVSNRAKLVYYAKQRSDYSFSKLSELMNNPDVGWEKSPMDIWALDYASGNVCGNDPRAIQGNTVPSGKEIAEFLNNIGHREIWPKVYFGKMLCSLGNKPQIIDIFPTTDSRGTGQLEKFYGVFTSAVKMADEISKPENDGGFSSYGIMIDNELYGAKDGTEPGDIVAIATSYKDIQATTESQVIDQLRNIGKDLADIVHEKFPEKTFTVLAAYPDISSRPNEPYERPYTYIFEGMLYRINEKNYSKIKVFEGGFSSLWYLHKSKEALRADCENRDQNMQSRANSYLDVYPNWKSQYIPGATFGMYLNIESIDIEGNMWKQKFLDTITNRDKIKIDTVNGNGTSEDEGFGPSIEYLLGKYPNSYVWNYYGDSEFCVNSDGTDWKNYSDKATQACPNGYTISDTKTQGYDEFNKKSSVFFRPVIQEAKSSFSPILSEVTPAPLSSTNQKPSYTFHSDQAGTITYSGDCSSDTNSAVVGNNTIIFKTLGIGEHKNCQITVTNANGHASSTLSVSSFTINTPFPIHSLFKGSGCWITNGTVSNEFATSGVFDWYVATDPVLKNENFPKINKPFVLALSTSQNPISNDVTEATIGEDVTIKAIKSQIEAYRSNETYKDILSGVIWDFEYQCAVSGSCTDTEKNARKLYLGYINNFVHSLGLPFGASVWGNPVNYNTACGISFAEISQFVDFIVPQLYCQKNNGGCNNPALTQSKWTDENNAATVPLVALAAIETTDPVVAMTSQQLIDNYSSLNPKPTSIGYWNPVLTSELIAAIAEVEGGSGLDADPPSAPAGLQAF